MKLFSETTPWYKGNLHTHTTLSDGQRSPEEAAALYRERGYHFIAVTDHRKRYPGAEDRDFIILPGGEYHYQPGVAAYHILGIGLREEVASDNGTEPQELIRRVNAAGGLAILAHPAWSLLTCEEAMALDGYIGMEIYNGISDAYGNRGFSDVFMDTVAARGRLPLVFAVDDVHFYDRDPFLGWIMVQAEEFTTEGLLRAIRAGHFYASQGPELRQISAEDGVIRAQTGPVQKICFMSNTWYTKGRSVYAPAGQTITAAEYVPVKTDRWLRVEAVDAQGRRCFSNYIDLTAL